MSAEYIKDLIDVRALLLGSAKIKFKAPLTELITILKSEFPGVQSDTEAWAEYFDTYQGFLFEKKYDRKNPKHLLKNWLTKIPDNKFKQTLYNRLKVRLKDRLNNRLKDRLKDVLRFRLGNYTFQTLDNRKYSAKVFLFIYPSLEIINIFTNIIIGDISTEEMIFTRKSIQFNNKHNITFQLDKFFSDPLLLKDTDKIKTFEQLNEKILQKLSKFSWSNMYNIKRLFYRNYETYCDKFAAKSQIKHSMLLEVRCLRYLPPFLSFDAIEKRYSRKLYGLLYCDEGFNFVPPQVAKNGLKESFGSREHFRIYSSSIGVLMINLIDSPLQKKYEDSQTKTANYFGDTKSADMFEDHPPIAGLENGALQAMERAAILSVIIQKDLSNMNTSIRSIIRNGKDMISTINTIADFKNLTIEPMSELTESLIEKFGINKGKEMIREKLDIAKDDNQLIRQKRLSRIALIIAFASFVYSTHKVILTFLTAP